MYGKKELILKAYELLDRATPLKKDCGRLCGSICCKGDEHTGMWLFPGEDEFFSGNDNFKVTDCGNNFGYKAVICSGSCDRHERPLACRFFPYFPMTDEQGFDVRADIRGIRLCPLLLRNIKPNHDFIRQIRIASRLLSRDEEIRNYIKNINEMLDEIEYLAERQL
ncbi:MAG: hypothetical protein LUG85_07700 [Clostridiales bacterium]|nr:hypothetical protein [Clostridiales bacterium]